ncbi:MAG TPA: hypothetical protein PKK06_18125 [Phycisphaerae bacterium]|nr:hypothetical protein [Phycisphaerae bacterium]HNU47140.1 hypothetical protein [Phycisphaerae bacterium]
MTRRHSAERRDAQRLADEARCDVSRGDGDVDATDQTAFNAAYGSEVGDEEYDRDCDADLPLTRQGPQGGRLAPQARAKPYKR